MATEEFTGEEWRPTLHIGYEASSLGRVRRVGGKPLSPAKRKDGRRHIVVRIGGKSFTRLTYRLVAEAFLEPAPGKPHINHIDGDKSNCIPSNLEYVTPSENAFHAYRLGLVAPTRGERSGMAKLNDIAVLCIRHLHVKGVMLKTLAAVYGIAPSNASAITTGFTWQHVGGPRTRHLVPVSSDGR